MKRRGHFRLIQYRFVFAIVFCYIRHMTIFNGPPPTGEHCLSCTIYSAVQTENSNSRAEGSSVWPFYFLYVIWKSGKGGTEENIFHEVHFLTLHCKIVNPKLEKETATRQFSLP